MSSFRFATAPSLALLFAACSQTHVAADADTLAATRRSGGVAYAYQRIPLDTSHVPGGVIDSVFPMPEMIRRFRAGLPELSSLQGGEMSRQALVTRFVAALAAADKPTLGRLTLSRAEWAYLFFPNTADAANANGLPPQRRWDQLTLRSEKGIGRALARLGGRPLTLGSLACPNPPVTSGPMTLHAGCRLTLKLPDGSTFSGPLFSSMIEYAGRFKFVSYANDM